MTYCRIDSENDPYLFSIFQKNNKKFIIASAHLKSGEGIVEEK